MKDKEFLQTEAFVKEAADKVNEQIDQTDKHVVVLNGGRGCGKTSVLLSREQNSLDSSNLAIYQTFESLSHGFNYSQLNPRLVDCYYEVMFAQNLLGYIRNNKPEAFTEYEVLYEKVNHLRIATINFIARHGKKGDMANQFEIKKGDYTLGVIEALKSAFAKDELTLMIDRFDWMDGRSKAAQEHFRNYFDMFDKVILTTDDDKYSSSYPTVTASYGRDMDIAVNILQSFVTYSNAHKEFQAEMIDPEDVNPQTIDYLVRKANGNISLMKNVIDDLSYYNYGKAIINDEDLIEQFKTLTDKKVNATQTVNNFPSRVLNKPKFWL